jgi:hemerythrin superfamily protein
MDNRTHSYSPRGDYGGQQTASAVGWAAAGAGAVALLFAGRKLAMQAPTALAEDWSEGLAREHRMVMALLDKAAELSDDQNIARRAVMAKVKMALTKHALQEENVVYPALREAGEGTAVAELISEHGDIKHHLYLFETLPADGPDFRVRLQSFRAIIADHVAEEEQRLFPALKAELATRDANRKVAMAMNKEGLIYA